MANGKKGRVLIVEDDLSERQSMADLLEAWGYETEVATDGEDALGKMPAFEPDIIVSDLRMPRMTGMDLLKHVREEWPSVAVIILTGQGTIAEGVEAVKLGALNFIEKPIEPARLQVELRNCRDKQDSARHLESANRRLRDAGLLGRLVGHSKHMEDVMGLIQQIAPSSASVLITGESGTGKELAARTIHELSPRASRPFVAVNCAAIPESLMESEIFGHEKGAFTGATERRLGCFELADGGTLLLDEIGEMPLPTQAKLLRVLEDSRVRRLGSKHEISVDVRLLAATNKIPAEAVAKGQLRNDLYFRLNVVQIEMPPLREHLDDLEDIVLTILRDLSRKHGRDVQSVDNDVLEAFRHYSWPGNVREVRNILERGVVVSTDNVLHRKDISAEFGRTVLAAEDDLRLRPGLTVEDAERRLIVETLAFAGNNKTKAAQMLGISLKTLHNKLKQYETQPQN